MKAFVLLAVVCGTSAAILAEAQVRKTTPPPAAAQVQARQDVAALEAALENAVRYGEQMLDQRLQESTAANMVMLAGMARARGFRLDGYGVVFDVEFPSLRRSMIWSMRELERPDPPGSPRPGIAAASSGIAAPKAAVDPRAIYLAEITNALVDAILEHGAPVGVGPDEWLTVAARESVDRRFVPEDPSDAVMTLILRIKGSDLKALGERRLPREEGRKRVDIRQY